VLVCPRRVAIEVELTLKSRARLATILNELSRVYEQTWYFAPERLLPTLNELADEAPYANVSVHRYPPLVAEVTRSALDLDLTSA
jgi:hypothetical protein